MRSGHLLSTLTNRIFLASALLAVLSIGGDLATRRADLANDFLLVLVGLILIFMAVTEYLGGRRALGGTYLTPGLAAGLRRRPHP